MAKEPKHRHNGGPLNDEDREKLWGHIRALEVLAAQKAEISEDEAARKGLAKSDGFDTGIVAAIIKRRKNGHGETITADQLLRVYEEALEDQGALPIESVRQQVVVTRRSPEEIAQELHGQDLPPDPFASNDKAADRLRENLHRLQEAGVTMTIVTEAEQYEQALALVTGPDGKASTSWLQRQMRIGYNQGARLIERMQREQIVSEPDHMGRREVLAKAIVASEQKAERDEPAKIETVSLFDTDDAPAAEPVKPKLAEGEDPF